MTKFRVLCSIGAILIGLLPTFAAANNEELAKQLQTPIAALVSVPAQFNYDNNIGADEKDERYITNIQPVIPVSISENWNAVCRTILPIVKQKDIYTGAGEQTGIGDILQSVFFSPKKPTYSGWIWGVGPVLAIPTGSHDTLTADNIGGGPTVVALKQSGPWTIGGMANHVWSMYAEDERYKTDASYFQPFLSYTTPTSWSFTLNTEASYDYRLSDLTVPVNLTVSKVTKIGGQLISFSLGGRYWVQDSVSTPKGFGMHATDVFMFPNS